MLSDAGQPFADVLGGERHAFRRQVVRLDEVADRLADAGAQPVLVRAAGRGRDAVHVRADVLVGRFGPLQHEIEPQAVVLVQGERRVVHRLRAALRDDLLQVVDDPFGVLEDQLLARGFVVEDDLHAFVQVADDLEPVLDHRRIELDLRKDGGVGMEVDGRAGAARRPQLLQRTDRLALLEPHFPLRAVALHRRDELLRQRVDDARADAVQAAGGLVVAGLELPAGVEHGEDDLERALLRRRMLVDRDAAAVVLDGDGRAVGVQRDPDVRGVAVHRLVDRVVENLPDEVVEPGRADAADDTCPDACGRAPDPPEP